MNPEIEHRDLGGGWLEGIFLINEVSAHLALQTGIPEATIQARIVEAYGYCRRPPKGGERVLCMQPRLYSTDDQAIRAMRRVIFDFITAATVDLIVLAYLADDFGDPYNIACIHLGGEVHPHVVMAVLDNLRDEGRLPRHPSWS